MEMNNLIYFFLVQVRAHFWNFQTVDRKLSLAANQQSLQLFYKIKVSALNDRAVIKLLLALALSLIQSKYDFLKFV
jgi:hypothetical protein